MIVVMETEPRFRSLLETGKPFPYRSFEIRSVKYLKNERRDYCRLFEVKWLKCVNASIVIAFNVTLRMPSS